MKRVNHLTRVRLLEWTLPLRADGSPRREKLHYGKLSRETRETRFLKILPYDFSNSNPLVCCELVQASVRRDYVALSYCWGNPNNTTPVVVDGIVVDVTVNLEAALRALRRAGVTLVWADALSINQRDPLERSYQVQNMGWIYSKATRVVAWLGESRKSNEALAEDQLGQDFDASSRYLASLADYPYWRRMWIIQEISRAREVSVWHGDTKLDLDHFLEYSVGTDVAIPQIHEKPDALRAIQDFRFREQSQVVIRMPPAEGLVRSRRSHATDERDRMYALLSLTCDGETVVRNPSYTDHPDQVFKDATGAMIVNHGQTAVILLAGERGIAEPSWTPRWSTLSAELPPWITQHACQQRITLEPIAEYKRTDENAVLVQGLRLDSIAQTRVLRNAPSDEDWPRRRPGTYGDSTNVLLELWGALTAGELNQYNEHVASQSRNLSSLGEVYRTFRLAAMLMGMGLGQTTSKVPKVLRKWYNDYQNIRLHGHRLRYWLESHYQNMLKRPWQTLQQSGIEDTQTFETECEALQEGLKLMARHRMDIAVTEKSNIVVAWEGSKPDDLLCQLQNCGLFVLLRRVENSVGPQTPYRYVGEVSSPRPEK